MIENLTSSPAELISSRSRGGSVSGSSEGDGREFVVVVVAKGCADGFKGGGLKKFGGNFREIMPRVEGAKGFENFSSGLGGEALSAEEPVGTPQGT